MFFVFQTMRNLRFSKFHHQLKILSSFNKIEVSQRNLHVSVNLCMKMFMENENKYAYSIMESKGYTRGLNIEKNSNTLSKKQFDQILKEDWSKVEPNQLFEVFSILGTYCSDNNLCISDKMFDDLIDNLTDSISHASDKQLESLFYSLLRWPETASIRTRNYIEVWAALDDECLNRLKRWTIDEMLSFVSLFFMLNVTRVSDFTYKCILKLAAKAKQLSPGQLVQTMFFIGVFRKPPFDMHNLELHAIEQLQELSLDDLAIISMGFFKSKTPIRSLDFILKIIDKIIENSKDAHEVSLAALLKVIRYSTKMTKDDSVYRLLDSLQHQVPKLSVMCTVHIALLGTSTLTFHKDCLNKIADKMINTLTTARLKDMERLVLTYGTFNHMPPVKNEQCLFEKIIEELRKSDREAEIEKHRRSFACCVNYLSLLGFYPVDLMNRILSPEFLENTYGKYCYLYGREILNIHNSFLIFGGQGQTNRLSDKVATILAKKYTDYIPDENYSKQYNVSEKMMLDVMQILRDNRGGDDYVIGDHIVTHHQRGDIIICNSHSGIPLPVKDMFDTAKFGLIKKPPDDNQWIALIIAGRNAIIRGTDMPTGYLQVKVKELKALGFRATLVPWSVYSNMKTNTEKSDYLNELIKMC